MLWVFIVTLPEIAALIIFAVIGLAFILSCISKRAYAGRDPYIALLLSFLISGAGLAYLGLPFKGLIWHSVNCGMLVITPLLSQTVSIEDDNVKYFSHI